MIYSCFDLKEIIKKWDKNTFFLWPLSTSLESKDSLLSCLGIIHPPVICNLNFSWSLRKNTYGKSTQSAWGNMNLKLCVIWPSVMLQPTSVPSATVHKNKKWEMNKGHRKRATNWNITNLLWINKCHTVWCNTVFIMWLNTHHNRFIILLILNVDFSSTLQYQIYICSRCSW